MIFSKSVSRRPLCLVILGLLLTSTFLVALNIQLVAGDGGWWDTNWTYRRQISVTSAKIDTDLTNFPVLVYLSASSGLGSADVTSVFDEVGGDYDALAFVGEDGERYYFEVERWDSVGEEAWVWVRMNVSSTADTLFYLYYDASQDGSAYHDSTKVWDSRFKAVYHMQDITTSTIADSTNNNDGNKKGANEPHEVAAFVGKGQDFDGTDDYVGCGNDAAVQVGQLTLEAAVRFDTIPTTGTHIGILGRWDPPANQRSYTFYLYGASGPFLMLSDDGTWTSDTHKVQASDPAGFSANRWYYYAGTYNGISPKMYRNGTDVTQVDFDGFDGDIHSGTAALALGCHLSSGTPYRFFDGKLDEVRISDVARSASWVKATYETQSDSLLSYGSEEHYSPVMLNSPSSGGTATAWTVDFSYTPAFGVAIDGACLWLNLSGTWQRAQWNTTAVQDSAANTISYSFSTEATYTWNIEVVNSTGSYFASSNWLLTVDVSPRIRNVGSSSASIPEGGTNLLHAQAYDGIGLDWAWLATNETGAWKDYNTIQSSWSHGSDIPETLADSVAVAYSNSSGDYVYTFAGCHGTSWDDVITTVRVYTVATDTWTQVATQTPDACVRYAGVQVGEAIYLFGGRLPGGTSLAKTNVYYPKTNTWDTTKNNMPYGAWSGGICYNLNGDGLIHLFGGCNEGGMLSAHTTYNVTSDTFDTSPADLPTVRQGFAWGQYKGKLYVVGGIVYQSGTYTAHNDVFCYDPTSDSWTSKTPLPVNRGGSMGYTQIGRFMYWVEGWEPPSAWYTTAYRYSFVEDTWTQVSDGYIAMDGSWTCSIGDRLYVVGGRYETTMYDSLQIMEQKCLPFDLDCAADSWVWSNFTWSNSSIEAGTTIQWRIHYNDTYGNVAATSIQSFTIGAPSIESCNLIGAPKDTFNPGDAVYVNGSGYGFSTTYPLYILNDITWTEGTPISLPVVSTTVSSNSTGHIWPPTQVWGSAVPGEYDIIVDVNNNGIYDVGIDALDDLDVSGAGFFVIPEYILGTVLALAACFAGFAAYRSYKAPRGRTL